MILILCISFVPWRLDLKIKLFLLNFTKKCMLKFEIIFQILDFASKILTLDLN